MPACREWAGEETFPELRKIRPQVKVLISSGYSEDETMSAFQGARVAGFFQKPYTSAGSQKRSNPRWDERRWSVRITLQAVTPERR